MDLPRDKYGFNVDIVNNGTIDAMLSGYTIRGISPTQSEIIEYHFTYVDGDHLKEKDLLKAGDSETVHFDVYHLENLFDEDQKMNIVVTLDYVQADDTAIERD